MSSELSDRGAGANEARRQMEAMIDEMSSQSFPASDAPSWGAAGLRLRQLEAHARQDGPGTPADG